MKKIIITAILMVACIIANGQNYTTLGVGITQPVGVLHIHSSTVYIPPVLPGTNEDGGGNRVFDYQTTFHITNTNTGTSDGDGFMIDQFNNNVTFRQFEQGKMSFMAPNGQGFTLTQTADFGIGTTTPAEKLHVVGNARVEGFFNVTSRTVIGSDCQTLTLGKAHAEGLGYGTSYIGFNAQRNSSTNWTCNSSTTQNGGAVIWTTIYGDILFANLPSDGTSSSQTFTDNQVRSHVNLKLSADGLLMAKEVKVTLTGWPDYVFGDGYKLLSLEETERYIRDNGHLPDVPSAAEVEEEGLSLGEMNKVLLQKVEELTLHVIELQKQIDELKTKERE